MPKCERNKILWITIVATSVRAFHASRDLMANRFGIVCHLSFTCVPRTYRLSIHCYYRLETIFRFFFSEFIHICLVHCHHRSSIKCEYKRKRTGGGDDAETFSPPQEDEKNFLPHNVRFLAGAHMRRTIFQWTGIAHSKFSKGNQFSARQPARCA